MTTPSIEPLTAPAVGVVLDDLSFDDLLRIALADIPGSSRGAWTLHGPVDPGITVLELYCWLFEQRLFMAGQQTEPVMRAALRLLGIGDPRTASAATTVLALRPGAAPAVLPAGTVMDLDRDPSGRAFATTADVAVLPVSSVRAEGGLGRAGDVLDLVLTVTAVPAGRPVLTLLADLDAPPGTPPGWAAGAPEVPPPADLGFTALGPGAASQPAEPVEVDDGTGGLRRPGLLAFAWPAAWSAPGKCRLRITAQSGSWTEPVRLRAVHPNAAPAEHLVLQSVSVDAELARFLPLPGRRLRLPSPPGTVCDRPGAVRLTVTEADGAVQEWRSVTSWTGAGPGDRVMLADRARSEVVFGDGRAGRILRPAANPASRLVWSIGAGPAGNLGAGSGWVQDGGPAVAVNPVPASGGAPAETPAQVRQRAGDDLGRPVRTVHAADTEELAAGTPGAGIARAHALPGLHPDFPCTIVPGALAVTVVPFAVRDAPPDTWTLAPMPDDGALAAVRAVLAAGRLAGQELFVLPPVYRALSVVVTIGPSAQEAAARTRIRSAVTRFVDPLTGGDGEDGWPFGGVVRPSRLAALARTAAGPAVAVTEVTVALDGGTATACDDLPIGSRELVRLADVQVATSGAAQGILSGTGLL